VRVTHRASAATIGLSILQSNPFVSLVTARLATALPRDSPLARCIVLTSLATAAPRLWLYL